MPQRVTFEGRKLPLKLRNIAEREAAHQGCTITIRSMQCGRGCAHGRAFIWERHIRLYLATHIDGTYFLNRPRPREITAEDRARMFDNEQNRYLMIHELAHLASARGGHDDWFYSEAIRIAQREKCLRGFLNWQGGRAKAYWRRVKRADRRAAA